MKQLPSLISLMLAFTILVGMGRYSAETAPQISCSTGLFPSIFADNLVSPDGLAFGRNGLLHVAEEAKGQVTQLDLNGNPTPILINLASPEGIGLDTLGQLYAVEDIANGRLIRRDVFNIVSTLAEPLDAPEDVVIAPNGRIFVSESNAQFVASAIGANAKVTEILANGTQIDLASTVAEVTGFTVEFISFSGLALHADGTIYAANETSGMSTTAQVGPATFTLTTTKSILTIDPDTQQVEVFARGLTSPEGLDFTQGDFPLYVVEEELGRLSAIDQAGMRSTVCEGFIGLEDVVVGADGSLYVSDDSAGIIYRIQSTNSLTKTVFLPIIRH